MTGYCGDCGNTACICGPDDRQQPATTDAQRLHRQLAPLAALSPGDRAQRLRHGWICRVSYQSNDRDKITIHACACGVAALDQFIRTGEVRPDDE